MRKFARFPALLAALGVLLCGCKSSDPGNEPKQGEAPKRPPKTATLYVETKGEPVNAGGKKVEKADEDGRTKGAFSPKDLLAPGMFLLVSAGTAVGGSLLVKAVDKKDRPAGPAYVESGGTDGTFVPMDKSSSGSGTPETGPDPSTPVDPGTPPDPASVTAVAKVDETAGSKTLAAGTAILSTPSSILLSMGYSSSYSGPSYVKATMTDGGKTTIYGMTVHVYAWTLSLDRTTVAAGDRVDVFASFDSLPDSTYVCLRIYVYGGAKIICDHVPQVGSLPTTGLPGDTWLFKNNTFSDYSEPQAHYFLFKSPPPGTRVRLGYLSVSRETDLFGTSDAVVTVH